MAQSQTAETTAMTGAEAETLLRAVCAAPPPAQKIERVLIEFVSANSHGPLSASHGRGGVLGDSLAALLSATGSHVTREFYVNDATNSRQTRLFGRAVLAHWRHAKGTGFADSANDYALHVARALEGSKLPARLLALPPAVAEIKAGEFAAKYARMEQEIALDYLGIGFDQFFFENGLHGRGVVASTLKRLRDANHAYEKNGALWLRSTAFGDEADRALLREDGTPTYLAGDLAYHADKFERGFDRLVDVWDADHAGYVERTWAGLAALGYDPARLQIVLHGPVRVLKDGTELKTGGVVTLEELHDEVPRDALRWLLLLIPHTAVADIDVDRAKRYDTTNPAWYIKETRSKAAGYASMPPTALPPLTPAVQELIKQLSRFNDAVTNAAQSLSPVPVVQAALQIAREYQAVHGDVAGWSLLHQAVAETLDRASRLVLSGAES